MKMIGFEVNLDLAGQPAAAGFNSVAGFRLYAKTLTAEQAMEVCRLLESSVPQALIAAAGRAPVPQPPPAVSSPVVVPETLPQVIGSPPSEAPKRRTRGPNKPKPPAEPPLDGAHRTLAAAMLEGSAVTKDQVVAVPEARGGLVNPSGPGATEALAAMPAAVSEALHAHAVAGHTEATEFIPSAISEVPSNVVPIKPPVEVAAQAVVAETAPSPQVAPAAPVDLTGGPPLHPDVVAAPHLKAAIVAFQDKMGVALTLEAMREACKNWQAMVPVIAKIPPANLADRVERTMTAMGAL